MQNNNWQAKNGANNQQAQGNFKNKEKPKTQEKIKFRGTNFNFKKVLISIIVFILFFLISLSSLITFYVFKNETMQITSLFFLSLFGFILLVFWIILLIELSTKKWWYYFTLTMFGPFTLFILLMVAAILLKIEIKENTRFATRVTGYRWKRDTTTFNVEEKRQQNNSQKNSEEEATIVTNFLEDNED